MPTRAPPGATLPSRHLDRERLLVIPGMLEGFTTFSSLSVDSLIMIERGETRLEHMLADVAGSLLAAAIGFRLARLLPSR